jgi:hypothetical protein
MVYDHLLNPEYIVNFHRHSNVRTFPHVQTADDSYQTHYRTRDDGITDKEVEDLFNDRYVGKHFAEDISRFLYSRETFNVSHYTLLEYALESPFFPRGLRIHCWESDSAMEMEKFSSRLLLDRQFQGKTAVELVLHLKPASCASVLRIIAPTMFKLKEKGASIAVIRAWPSLKIYCRERSYSRCSYTECMFYFHRDGCRGWRFSEHDLTWLFEGGIEDFKRNIMLNGKKRKTLAGSSFLLNCIVLIFATGSVGRPIPSKSFRTSLRAPTYFRCRGASVVAYPG